MLSIDPHPYQTALAAVVLMLTVTAGVSLAISAAAWALHAAVARVRRYRVRRELRLVSVKRAATTDYSRRHA